MLCLVLAGPAECETLFFMLLAPTTAKHLCGKLGVETQALLGPSGSGGGTSLGVA